MTAVTGTIRTLTTMIPGIMIAGTMILGIMIHGTMIIGIMVLHTDTGAHITIVLRT